MNKVKVHLLALLLAAISLACGPTGADGGPVEADPGLVRLRVTSAPPGASIAMVELRVTGDVLTQSEFTPASGVSVRVLSGSAGELDVVVRTAIVPGKVLGTLCLTDRNDLADNATATVAQVAAGAPGYALLSAAELTVVPESVPGDCIPAP